MYIEIAEVNGEKTINLPFPIDNTDQSKESGSCKPFLRKYSIYL